jgi:L-amino acid N-acyltransferase YncA
MGLMQMLARFLGGPAHDLSRQAESQRQAQRLDYPAHVTLRGEDVTLRLFEASDRDAMLAFARSLPEHDLLFLRRDITEPDQVDAWIEDVAAGRYVTVVVERGSEIVGYATVASDPMTWARHLAEIRVLVSPALRGVGFGGLLTEQAFAIARERGVRKMIARMTTDQEAAIRAFERMGFAREAVLRGQVIDREGALHDLQIMGLDVEAFRARLDLAQFQAQIPTVDF